MSFLKFVPYYGAWHYGQGLEELFGNLATIIKFTVYFFSIPQLFSTLFTPWERMGEEYQKKVDIAAWAGTFALNMILRILGFFIRGFIILVGIIFVFVVFVLSLLALVVWLVLPLILLIILVL